MIHLVNSSIQTKSSNNDDILSTWAFVEELMQDPNIEYAHPNWVFTPSSHPPNDSLFSMQWNLEAAKVPDAWHVTQGSSNIRIAILDSGRTAHPDIQWHPTLGYPIDDTVDTSRWRHGTHVASIAGGAKDNNFGVAGVCPECSLIPVRVAQLGSAYFTLSLIMEGIDWAKSNSHIMNMSFEIDMACTSPMLNALRDEIAEAITAGVHIVAAAGNQNVSAANTSPASCQNVIAVAATDKDDQLSDYSNFSAVTLSAPGGGGNFLSGVTSSAFGAGIDCSSDSLSLFNPFTLGVPAAWTISPASGNVNCFRYLSGTSMAAPHVAGTLGLMLSIRSLSPQFAKLLLVNSASELSNCGSQCGAGLINAKAAVCLTAATLFNQPTPPACL